MSNIFQNWWRSRQFYHALKRGNLQQAQAYLREIEASGAKLNWLEKLFKKYLTTARDLKTKTSDNRNLRQRIQQQFHCIDRLEKQLDRVKIKPDLEFINYIRKAFKLYNHDRAKIQCTGIDNRIFDNFEHHLVEFLEKDFKGRDSETLTAELQAAFQDLDNLRRGIDPQYNRKLSSQVYLLKYFLDNVYCSYIAWFLIYELGRFIPNPKILDIAAGPATLAYGLALLLESNSGFDSIPPLHISYYSLEKERSLQYQGLKFWRSYIESKQKATNLYFRFETTDVLAYAQKSKSLPPKFFDFICVSHGFFYDLEQRDRVHKVYQQIFRESLSEDGWVLLIVQGHKLFKSYNIAHQEDIQTEENVIQRFVGDLGLTLNWYQYVTSTESRLPMGKGFAEYARDNLPNQPLMNELKRQYCDFIDRQANYVIADYIILAKPQ
jgi:hypothetical protein